MPPKNPKLDLKRKYQRFFEIGLIFAISILILSFRYFPDINNAVEFQEPPQDIIITVEPPPTGKPEPPPPPAPVIIHELFEDDDLPDIPIDDTDLDVNLNVEPTLKTVREEPTEYNLPFRFVEKMPEIVGGLNALQRNVIYPEIAVKAGVEGKVILEVVINSKGIVESIEVIKGIGAGCDRAAIEAVKKTKFVPGMQRGKSVSVVLSIPIKFKLQNN